MAGNVTFMELPPGVEEDPSLLRRFLSTLLENLDVAFGNRGNQGFVDASSALGISSAVANQAFAGQTFTNIKRYSKEFNLLNERDLIDRGFLLGNSSNNEIQTLISDISYTQANPSSLYSQGEAITVDDGVNANTNKINEILTALRSASIIEV